MSPHWLHEAVIVAVHEEQIAEHSGRAGIRDRALLASALARPHNKAAYGNASVFDPAAAYAFGIIRNHPFIDGNKRTAFLSAYVFLNLNGWELTAPEPEVVVAMLTLAKGDMGEDEFSAWLKDHSEIRQG